MIVLASFAGCYYPTGDGVSVTFDGSVNATNTGIVIDGNVSSHGIPEQETFEDVRVVMYDEQGTVLHSERIGDLDAESDRRRINVSASAHPEYITFESEDFWAEPNIQVPYFYRSYTGEYWRDEAAEQDDLPVT